MNFDLQQFTAAAPEIFILIMACITLLVDAFLPPRNRIVTYILVQATLIGALVLSFLQFGNYPAPIFAFSGNYVLDDLAITSKLFIYLFSLFAFAYAREYIQSRKMSNEYYLLGLFS